MKFARKKPKSVSLKRSEFISVKKKQNLLGRKMEEMRDCLQLLAKINFNLSMRDLRIVMLILAVIGFLAGVLMQNKYVAVLFALAFPVMFWEYLLIKKGGVEAYLDGQIIKYAELIKNSYVTTGNIKDSIQNNLRRFEEPVKSIFTEFIDEVDIYNYSVKDAFARMNQKLESPSLKEFTDQLIYCDNDRRFINSLEVTVQHLNDKRDFLQRWQFTQKDILNKYLFMLVLVNGMSLFLLFGFGDIADVFMASNVSKLVIAIYVLVQVAVTLIVFKRVNKVTM